MISFRRPPVLIAAGVLCLALVLAGVVLALGGNDDDAGGATVAAGGDLGIDGTDPISGQPVALADFRGGPVVLVVWASWCEVCNAEAPAIERLAEDGRDDLAVIAIGGRAKAPEGRKFAARHRLVTPTLLFDEPMAAWEAYRIPAQPGAVLLDRDGRERQRWLGAFDTAEALAAARAL